MLNLVIEGPDGAGKGTFISGINSYLKSSGFDTMLCVNPGTTRVGQEIRTLVKHKKDVDIDRYTEQILMAADLTSFIHEVLKPEIARGRLVISDRSNLISGMIYARAADVSWEQIKAYQNLSMVLRPPMMDVIVLHADYDTLLSRQHHDIVNGVEVECKFQNRGNDFHRRVNELYKLFIDAACGKISVKSETDDGFHMVGQMVQFVRRLECFKFRVFEDCHRSCSVWPIDASLSKDDILRNGIEIIKQILVDRS